MTSYRLTELREDSRTGTAVSPGAVCFQIYRSIRLVTATRLPKEQDGFYPTITAISFSFFDVYTFMWVVVTNFENITNKNNENPSSEYLGRADSRNVV
jgi:hypothetical protein